MKLFHLFRCSFYLLLQIPFCHKSFAENDTEGKQLSSIKNSNSNPKLGGQASLLSEPIAQKKSTPFDPDTEQLVLPDWGTGQSLSSDETDNAIQKRQQPSNTATIQPSSSSIGQTGPQGTQSPWSALIMPSFRFTRQWISVNGQQQSTWQLRALNQNETVPFWRKIFFRNDEAAAQPFRVLSGEFGPSQSIQVRHITSPKLLWDMLLAMDFYTNHKIPQWLLDNWQRYIRDPPLPVFALVNSVKNSVCVDTRLGQLMEDCVSNNQNGNWTEPDWSTMTRNEAEFLLKMLEDEETNPFSYLKSIFEYMVDFIMEDMGPQLDRLHFVQATAIIDDTLSRLIEYLGSTLQLSLTRAIMADKLSSQLRSSGRNIPSRFKPEDTTGVVMAVRVPVGLAPGEAAAGAHAA